MSHSLSELGKAHDKARAEAEVALRAYGQALSKANDAWEAYAIAWAKSHPNYRGGYY